MSDSPQSTASVAIARQLAAAHPDATLPCPLCDASPKAANLDRHLAKAHPEHAQAGGPGIAGPLRVRGIDRAMTIPAVVIMVLAGAAFMVMAIVTGGTIDVTIAVIFAGPVLLALALFLAVFSGWLPATLELDGDVLRVRWMLGLATKQVRLPAKLETGALMRKQGADIAPDGANVKAELVRIGVYLRLRGDGTITVGAENAPGLGAHWAQQGWSKAEKTRRSDIDLDRRALVALEYQLAARGQLTPKGG